MINNKQIIIRAEAKIKFTSTINLFPINLFLNSDK